MRFLFVLTSENGKIIGLSSDETWVLWETPNGRITYEELDKAWNIVFIYKFYKAIKRPKMETSLYNINYILFYAENSWILKG